jgi:hypothetical protein
MRGLYRGAVSRIVTPGQRRPRGLVHGISARSAVTRAPLMVAASTAAQRFRPIDLPTDGARAPGKLAWAGRFSAKYSGSVSKPLHNGAAEAIHQSGRVEIQ